MIKEDVTRLGKKYGVTLHFSDSHIELQRERTKYQTSQAAITVDTQYVTPFMWHYYLRMYVLDYQQIARNQRATSIAYRRSIGKPRLFDSLVRSCDKKFEALARIAAWRWNWKFRREKKLFYRSHRTLFEPDSLSLPAFRLRHFEIGG